MRKFAAVLFFVFGVALVLNTVQSFAQENVDDKFSFGKIVSVNAQQVAVKEYDFAKDADVEVAYQVTAETELGNINAVTDLVADDDVVIDYTEKDGKRVVMTLVKEDKGAEAPMGGDASPEAGVNAAVNALVPAANAEAPVQP